MALLKYGCQKHPCRLCHEGIAYVDLDRGGAIRNIEFGHHDRQTKLRNRSQKMAQRRMVMRTITGIEMSLQPQRSDRRPSSKFALKQA
ncbi:hypothetical protein FHS00_002890, partial [Limimaricola variabilis]